MSAQENKEMFRAIIEEVFNKGNYDALDEIFTPNYQEHQFGLSKDLAGVKQDFQWLRTAFPDIHLTIEEMVADGDKVWARLTCRGTNLGPLMGPPTGKKMEITVFDIVRFENGKAVEHWGVPDRFAQLAQLGLLPQPSGA